MDRFKELVEKAKLDSKKEFLKFVTGVYGIDKCVFEHIWNVPVIGLYQEDAELTIPLSTKNKDELIDILEEYIKEKIGNNNSCFIYLNEIERSFTQEEIEEWQKQLYSGEGKENYEVIIVYNEPELRKKYKELIQNNSKGDISKSQENLDKIFIDYVKGIITYEICHLNANYLIKSKQQLSCDVDYIKESEILINILKQIINNYQDGLTVEECLYSVIKSSEEKLKNNNLNTREILLLYILFSDELTEWMLFGAYDYVRENKLNKLIIKALGMDSILSNEELNQKLCKYLSNIRDVSLSKKQIEMIQMIGLSMTNENHKEEKPELLTKNIQEDKTSNSNYSLKVIDEKSNIIKRFFNKILNFFRKHKSNIKSWE